MSTISSFSKTSPEPLLLFVFCCLVSLLSLSWPLIGETQIAAVGSEHGEFEKARRRMIDTDLRGRGIKDRRVLQAMGSIPRHRFVPEGLRASAYADRPLPIGEGQTISQPYVVAFMTEALELKGTERVLEIGTGSGYQTAVLARLAAQVFSIEIIPKLSEQAKKILDQLGFKNVELKVGDGFFGWAEKAPFDSIVVTAAAGKLPEPLWRQLAEGGRLVMPLGEKGQSQKLVRVRKVGGKQVADDLTDVLFVPLTGAIQQETR
jgi:protein-L-isoaspartate(D-aspartate) O-methyltransferase